MHEILDYIYIGNSGSGIRAGKEDSTIPVVSLTKFKIDTIEYDDKKYIHTPLIDGSGNSQEDFNEAVNRALNCIEEYGAVLVHCSAGISRSSAVVSTIIAEKENISFNEAFNLVKSNKPNVNPAPELIKLSKEYLDETCPFEQKSENNN
jgi:protein-tyrosine phosphatase